MKMQASISVCLLLAFIIAQTQPFQINSATDRTDPNPSLIVEYIPEFKVTANDLKNVVLNQFKNVTIGVVSTSYATIDQSSFNLTYKNNSALNYITPLKVEVTNDSYAINFTFQITVFHLVGKKKYNCHFALSSDIHVNYTKQVDVVSGNIVISSYNSSFGPNLFNGDATCNQKESQKDKVRIHEAVSNTQSSSIYLELKKVLAKMKDRMQQNVQTQHFSQVFPTNPYIYQYYGFKMEVNVSTMAAYKFGDTGIVNNMRGSVPGSSHFAESLPSYQNGYNLFYSKQFIQNMIDYSISNYNGWKNIKSNRTNMRTSSFRFRLIDYQYIVPAVLKKYPKSYLADTEISCTALSYKNLQLTEKNINIQFTWSCIGSVQLSPTTTYNFINFQPTILYEVSVSVPGKDYLTVYARPQRDIDLKFNIIDGNLVQQVFMVKLTIEDGLFQFANYPVGLFFKVKPGSTQLKIAPQGIWIG